MATRSVQNTELRIRDDAQFSFQTSLIEYASREKSSALAVLQFGNHDQTESRYRSDLSTGLTDKSSLLWSFPEGTYPRALHRVGTTRVRAPSPPPADGATPATPPEVTKFVQKRPATKAVKHNRKQFSFGDENEY